MRNITKKYKIVGVKNKVSEVFEETINFREAKYLLNEYKKNMTLWKFKIKIVNTKLILHAVFTRQLLL